MRAVEKHGSHSCRKARKTLGSRLLKNWLRTIGFKSWERVCVFWSPCSWLWRSKNPSVTRCPQMLSRADLQSRRKGLFCYRRCWFASWNYFEWKRDTYSYLYGYRIMFIAREVGVEEHMGRLSCFSHSLKTCLKRVELAHNHAIVTWSILHV